MTQPLSNLPVYINPPTNPNKFSIPSSKTRLDFYLTASLSRPVTMKRAPVKRTLFPPVQEEKFKVTVFQDANYQPTKKMDSPFRFLLSGFVSTLDANKKDERGYPVQIKIPGVQIAVSMIDTQMYVEFSHGPTAQQLLRVPCLLHKDHVGGKLPDITTQEILDLSKHPRFQGHFNVSLWFTKNPKVATGYLNRILNTGIQKSIAINSAALCIDNPKHPLHFLTQLGTEEEGEKENIDVEKDLDDEDSYMCN